MTDSDAESDEAIVNVDDEVADVSNKWMTSLNINDNKEKDKYAKFLVMIRNQDPKDVIKQRMLADGLTQKDIAAFFRAYPVVNGSNVSKQQARPKSTNAASIMIPKPRQIAGGAKSNSKANEKVGHFGRQHSKRGGSAAEKNATYFAQMAKV